MAWSEIWTMSLAGAFSSAAWMVGEESVGSRGEFSLVSVWSRSERPLLVAATDPINTASFFFVIGGAPESFRALTNRYAIPRKC